MKIHNPLGNPYIHYYLDQQSAAACPCSVEVRGKDQVKNQEPNAQLKRERHLHLRPDVNQPSEREHLLETYSVKYEFRAQQIGRVYQN